jgi:hypothetical protein
VVCSLYLSLCFVSVLSLCVLHCVLALRARGRFWAGIGPLRAVRLDPCVGRSPPKTLPGRAGVARRKLSARTPLRLGRIAHPARSTSSALASPRGPRESAARLACAPGLLTHPPAHPALPPRPAGCSPCPAWAPCPACSPRWLAHPDRPLPQPGALPAPPALPGGWAAGRLGTARPFCSGPASLLRWADRSAWDAPAFGALFGARRATQRKRRAQPWTRSAQQPDRRPAQAPRRAHGSPKRGNHAKLAARHGHRERCARLVARSARGSPSVSVALGLGPSARGTASVSVALSP